MINSVLRQDAHAVLLLRSMCMTTCGVYGVLVPIFPVFAVSKYSIFWSLMKSTKFSKTG